MEKIKLINIIKNYGDRELLNIKNIVINKNDKVGIVGLNGSGKSTLLNIIANLTSIDKGNVTVNGKISYIKQFEDVDYELSGGERQKNIIYKKINEDSDILLADEPSSNLDIKSIEDLKRKLIEYNGTILIISHDRELLDSVCNCILEVDNGFVKLYKGNYSIYKEQKESEIERKRFEYFQYIQEKERLEKAIDINDNNAKSLKKAPSRMGNSEARLHKRKTADIRKKVEGHSKSMQTRLDKLIEKDKPQSNVDVKMKPLDDSYIKAQFAIKCDNLNIKKGNKDLILNSNLYIKSNSKTVIIGSNGVGKTSLVKEILRKDSKITVNPNLKIAFFSQNIDILDENKSIIDNVKDNEFNDESTVRTILANLLIKNDDIYKKVNILSGGERVKVAIAKLILSKANLLILDEPTNFLDIQSIEALEELIKKYKGTILLVTHDRKLADNVADNCIIFENRKLINFDGNYSEYLRNKKNKDNKSFKNNSSNKLLLEFRISALNSEISITNDENKKEILIEQYKKLLEEYKNI